MYLEVVKEIQRAEEQMEHEKQVKIASLQDSLLRAEKDGKGLIEKTKQEQLALDKESIEKAEEEAKIYKEKVLNDVEAECSSLRERALSNKQQAIQSIVERVVSQ